MSESRFQTQERFAQHGDVTTYRGVDPLTGLPVLIYRFPGKPTLAAGDLDSEHIPGVLASDFDGKQGELVVAYSSGYRVLEPPLTRDEALLILKSSAEALKDAADAGVGHGDIRPERFLMADGHLLVEGFGVRWPREHAAYPPPEKDGDAYARDVFAWAKTVLHLAEQALPPEMVRLLERCLATSPHERPSAKALFDEITRLMERPARALAVAEQARAVGPESDQTADEFDAFSAGHEGGFDAFESPEPRGGQRPPPPTMPLHASDEENDAILIHTDPGNRPGARSGKSSPPTFPTPPRQRPAHFDSDEALVSDEPTFVKELPPGASYRPGEEKEETRPPLQLRNRHTLELGREQVRNRRMVMLTLLVIAAAILGALALWRQAASPVAPAARSGPQYIVGVEVEPDTLRNVTLLIVTSPPGSSFEPGHEVTFVPGPAVLDQAGTWQLQGRFQNRFSDVVTIEVPRDLSVTLVIPETGR
jgi:hypothetical protein